MATMSARTISLAAVCLQSTVLAIVLHVSQANLKPGQHQYKASSAVLLTELGKLIISALLALRDTLKERATLLAPRHPLPTRELYMTSSEEDLLSPDPITPPRSISEGHRPAPTTRPDAHLRRRSSANLQQTLQVTLDMDGTGSASTPPKKLPEFKTLASFQWPHKPISPRLTEKLRKYAREMEDEKELAEPLVRKILDDPNMWVRRRRMGILRMLSEDIFGSDWFKMCVPAVLFALQNNLIYIAARNLSVPVFQITFQLKTLITALCAVLILGRRLALVQWISLATLGLGVAAMQLGAIYAKANDSHGHGDHPATSAESMNYLTGVSAVVVSCFSSAIAATYFELVIKRRPAVPAVEEVMLVAPPQLKPVSLWIRNIQLSLFSSVFGLLVVLFQANDVHFWGMGGLSLDFHGLHDPLDHWYDPVLRAGHGFFEGFTPLAWVVILLQTVGGLLIALALKHADNVSKSLSLSVSIVLTFIISVFLFDFKITVPSAIGGLAVVLSTVLFESAPRQTKDASRAKPNGQHYRLKGKPLLRRWHLLVGVVLVTICGSIAFPTRHFSITTAAMKLISSSQEKLAVHRSSTLLRGRPTVAITHIEPINSRLMQGAGPTECAWGVSPKRDSTRSAYGALLETSKPNYPYYVTNTDQYALDDILTTRFLSYSNLVPLLSTPSPDFIFLPVLSQIWSNPWSCNSPVLADGIEQTTRFLRELVQIVGKTNYPRIVLPIATIRSNLEKGVLTPEFMKEIRESVVVVSIENAPKTYEEGMKYLIDVPYPTAFHLSPSVKGPKPTVGSYFFNNDRPYLLHYAAAASHPWGLPASDPFNGFALRAKLRQEFETFSTTPGNSTSRILFDDISNSVDGAQQLDVFHSHMEQSVFCPMPAGDSPTRRAFYEALLLGCIPVLFRERSYGRLFPSSPDINDLSKYTVLIEENDVINSIGLSVVERLERIPASKVRKMQEHIRKITPQLQWSYPDQDLHLDSSLSSSSSNSQTGQATFELQKEIEREEKNPPISDAFETLLKELDRIKNGDWVAGQARDNRKGMKKFGAAAAARTRK
ncbi:uncharacterized protein JCM15063_005492 [Sporobolomyces koalae]|uniref:uncharacterized protein n=1 Tax=Sporobolomyces koalae TaxID=500713 RepID=UPI00317C00CD